MKQPHAVATGVPGDHERVHAAAPAPEQRPAWSKSALRAILINPRYTGFQVWNKQRTDEVLLDVDDVALGHTSVQRWNPTSKWVTSTEPAHDSLVDQQTFDRVQLMFTTRGPQSPRSSRTSRPYLFKGLLHCGICDRRMQGHRAHGESYYRCRLPNNFGLANDSEHPRNVYLREQTLVTPVDAWLATAFDPPARTTTIDALYDAQDDGRTAEEAALRSKIAELDARLVRYKATLDAGGDPAVVAGWIAQTNAERAKLHATLAPRPTAGRMTKQEIKDLVDQLGDIASRLREADPEDKADVYLHLGLYLRFDPHENRTIPGIRPVNRLSDAFRGEGKTDAKDAAVIADQARLRRDLRELHLDNTVIAELRMLTAHRADLAADRTRTINRLRIRLLGIFPALERALDFTNRGPLVLISQFQTPAALIAAGEQGLERWLRERKVRHADKLAAAAMPAAESQQVRIVGETMAGELVAQLATTVIELDRQLADLNKLVAKRFHGHRSAEVITSMVGIGDLLGA